MNNLNAPIPGQSLTTEPKNYPWEAGPAQFADPVDALLNELEELEKPKRMEAFLNLLELGLDVVTLTEGIVRNGVTKGKYSIDTGLIIAPIIHEQVKGTAEVAGITFDEGLDDEDVTDPKNVEYVIREQEARKILQDVKNKEEPELDDLEASLPEGPTDMQEESQEQPMPEEMSMGLMARPQGGN
tara:strand:+ start:654 stop:1208 length:555 start_codon:yes stop_codon:yes gene_type:complete